MNKKADSNILKIIWKMGGSYSSVILALIILSIIWGFLTPYFFTYNNFKNILVYIAANGTMAVGLTVVFLLGGIDLSQMALMAVSGMVAGFLYQKGFISGPMIIIVAALTGAVGGLLNGFLVSWLGILPFIVTLATQLIFRALAFIITNGNYIQIKDSLIRFIGFNTILDISPMFWMMLILYLIIGFMLKYTRFGRNIYSVGGSRVAAELSGINIRKTLLLGYIISGACAGFAAVLYMAQGSIAMNNAGTGCETDVISACVLGGVSMAGGRGTLGNAFLGILLSAVINNGMSLLSFDSYYRMLIRGIILVAAVYLDIIRERH